jgi:hypothetical protein
MEDYLRPRVEAGVVLNLEDPHVAFGMLRGMMIIEPQRSALLGQVSYPSNEEIATRAKMCVLIFLQGAIANKR